MKSQPVINTLEAKSQKLKAKKVFVGLSGGVDSAVSAALLKKEGFDVTGVFIKAWNPPGYTCTWREDRRSAMRAAATLDIPFKSLDLEKEYKQEVVDYMLDEYKAGRTPNPDVMCNKAIKFGHFLKWALENGADFVATGHYALRAESRSMNYELWESKDKNKDQSYFLWTLTQNQLSHILFPIGHLQKEEVRKLAAKFGLPQATRKDSQGLCFLGQIDMKEFLKDYLNPKKGQVLNTDGEVIGDHDGAILYTLGERHGFRIENKNTQSTPMYVVDKDIKKNTITVSEQSNFQKKVTPSSHEASEENRGLFLGNYSARLEKINLLDKDIENKKIECRYRYRQNKIPCTLSGDTVVFESEASDLASGQSVVFYSGERCLGGGVVEKVL